jgi:hypothetical protein
VHHFFNERVVDHPRTTEFLTTISKGKGPSIAMNMKLGSSRRRILGLVGVAGICGATRAFAYRLDGKHQSSSDDHIAWVVECLERMLTITPGISRSQLMQIFSTEGGISTALPRTFVSRDCPYFKINVRFRRMDSGMNGSDWLEERDDDLITDISGPFMQFSIMD